MPHHVGFVIAGYDDQRQPALSVYVRPDLNRSGRDWFARAAALIFSRFVAYSPDLDGWQLRADNFWQLWIRPDVEPTSEATADGGGHGGRCHLELDGAGRADPGLN